ncbi:MAG: hypothetical protein ABR613_02805 [Actinomycetota bacterium]
MEFSSTEKVTLSSGPTSVEVENQGDKRRKVRVDLVWTDLTAGGRRVDAEEVFVYSRRVPLAGGDTGQVTIARAPGVAVDEGTYSGVLRLHTRQGVQDRLRLELVVAGTAAPDVAATAEVAEWYEIQVRTWPREDFGGAEPIPLASEPAPTEGASFTAWLMGPGDDRIEVSGSVKKEGDDFVLDLTLPNDSSVGIYSGALDRRPGEAGGEVELTVERRDGPALPVIVLLASLAVAWIGQRLFPAGRTLMGLHKKERAALAKLPDGDTKGGLTLSGASAAAGAAGERRSKLWKRAVPATASELATAAAEVVALEAAAEVWTTKIESSAEALEDALNKVPVVEAPPAALRKAPRFVQEARGLVTGSLSVKEVAARKSAIDEATELAGAWGELYAQVLRYGDALDSISASDLEGEDARLLRRGRRLFNLIRWDLWHASGPGDLERRGVEKDLERLDEILGMLSGGTTSKGITQETLRTLGLLKASGSGSEVTLLSRLPKFVPGVLGIEWPLTAAVGTSIAGALLLLGTVALSIWGALTTLYFDNPFGTLRDYVSLVVWGLGAGAVLDLFNGALARLQPPEPESKTGAAPTP